MKLILTLTSCLSIMAFLAGCSRSPSSVSKPSGVEDVASALPQMNAGGQPTGLWVVTCKSGEVEIVPPTQLGSPQLCAPKATRQYKRLFGRLGVYCGIDNEGATECWREGGLKDTRIPALLANATTGDSNFMHGCAIDGEQHLHCWGNNSVGQAQLPNELSPTVVKPYQLQFKQVATSFQSTCAIIEGLGTSDNVRCWGSNQFKEMAVPAGLVAKEIVAGQGNFCAIQQNNLVTCWGIYDAYKTPPADLGAARSLTIGNQHACAVRISDSKPFCWGENGQGQTNIPRDITAVQALAAGPFYTCAIRADGIVRCWGLSGENQTDPVTVPDSLGQVKSLSAGGKDACVIRKTGDIRCWTFNGGELKAPFIMPVLDVISGPNSICAKDIQGKVTCWGENRQGELSLATKLDLYNFSKNDIAMGEGSVCRLDPNSGNLICEGEVKLDAAASTLSGNKLIVAGSGYDCAIKSDDTVFCWGDNRFGQTSVPTDLGPVRSIAAGLGHTCAITRDEGKVRCWGLNDDSQSNPPADLPEVMNISAGRRHSCAITGMGGVLCWGRNFDGQTQVPTNFTYAQQVVTGGYHSCLINSENKQLSCWGDNRYGQSTVPNDLGPVRQVVAGDAHTCAIRDEDSGLVCWGSNLFSQSSIKPYTQGNGDDNPSINTGSVRHLPFNKDMINCDQGGPMGGVVLNSTCPYELQPIYSISSLDPIKKATDIVYSYDIDVSYEAASCVDNALAFVSRQGPSAKIKNGTHVAKLTGLVGTSNLYLRNVTPLGDAEDVASSGSPWGLPCQVKVLNVAVNLSGSGLLGKFQAKAETLVTLIRDRYQHWLILKTWDSLANQTEDTARLEMANKLKDVTVALKKSLDKLGRKPSDFNMAATVWDDATLLSGFTVEKDVMLRQPNGTQLMTKVREFTPYADRKPWFFEAVTPKEVGDSVRASEKAYNSFYVFLQLPSRYVGTAEGEGKAREELESTLAEASRFLDLMDMIKQSLLANIPILLKELKETISPLFESYCSNIGGAQESGNVNGQKCH